MKKHAIKWVDTGFDGNWCAVDLIDGESIEGTEGTIDVMFPDGHIESGLEFRVKVSHPYKNTGGAVPEPFKTVEGYVLLPYHGQKLWVKLTTFPRVCFHPE